MRSLKSYMKYSAQSENKALADAIKTIMTCGCDEEIFMNYAIGTVKGMCELRDGEIFKETLIIDNGEITYTGADDIVKDRLTQKHPELINMGFVMCRDKNTSGDAPPIIWVNSCKGKIYYKQDGSVYVKLPMSVTTISALAKLLIFEGVLPDDKYIKYTVIL